MRPFSLIHHNSRASALRSIPLGSLALISLLIGCFSLGACSGKSSEAPKTAVKPVIAVETAVAVPGTLSEGIEVTGSLEAKRYADVKTQIPGLVKEVYVTEWVPVRKGQLLARIDVSETEALVKRGEAGIASAKANLAQYEVALNRAEREEARTLKLKEVGLATQLAVDDARTETAAAKARISAARAQIVAAEEETHQARARLNKGLVTAPMDGVIAMKNINIGDLASDAAAGAPIFKIVDNRILNLTVTVPSSDAARVKVGQPLEFSVDSLPANIFNGKVMFINPELTAADRSLKVIAEVKNDGNQLKSGLFAKGKILIRKRTGVIQVPRSSLANWDTATGSAVLFAVKGEQAVKLAVTTGAITGDQVEIVKGISPGEKYVTRGGFTLKEGDRISTAGAAK